MADFSREYCETHDFGMPGDFSIVEEFAKLKHNEYIPIICEGYGFILIANEKGSCQVGFRRNMEVDEEDIVMFDFELIKNMQYEEIKKIMDENPDKYTFY